jgi:hypothetical protein
MDMPDFDEIFQKIQQVSPMARSVIEDNNAGQTVPSTDDRNLNWKTVESNRGRTVQEIQKLEKFAGIATPVFRFRSTLNGPPLGDFFGRYIIDLNERRKWDSQIENVHELHTIEDLDAVTEAMGRGQYGTSTRLGLGYGQTKAAFGITPREQMFIYGLQEFADGSSVLWGTELSEDYNHLFPPGKRHTRAKSHLFAATLKPTGNGSFDVEYVLQLDIGGAIPSFLTTPILIDTVKNLFDTAQKEFAGATDSLQRFLEEKIQRDEENNWESILIPI